ncbi:hypothetical protein JHK86_016426 [Glycine max]|nr:hypothetical protein JHK86_016426 [Glycine max]
MAGQRDSPIIGLDSSTIDFPVSVWQHHHADINRHFQSIQLWPLPLRTNTRRYRKIPYGNEIFLLGDATVTHQIHLHWIWILFATATPLCSVHHQRQRPPPPPKPPPPPSSTPPSLTPPLIAPQRGSHTHSSPWPFSFVARVTHSLTASDINNVGPKPANKQSNFPNGGPIHIPGFCLPKALQPILPIFLQDTRKQHKLTGSKSYLKIPLLGDTFFTSAINPGSPVRSLAAFRAPIKSLAGSEVHF